MQPGIWMCCAPPWATASLTYLGFSYGTLLGATYAGLFPTHVRAMVLDGALDPADVADHSGATSRRLLSTVSCSSSSPPAPAPASAPWTPGENLAAAFQALLQQVRADSARRPSTPPGPSARRSCCTAPRPRCTRRDLERPGRRPPGRQPGRRHRPPRAVRRCTPAGEPTGATATCSRPTPPSTACKRPPRRWRPSIAAAPGRRGGRARVRPARHRRSGGVRGLARPGDRDGRRPSGPPGRRRSWWSAAPATRSRRTAGPSRWRVSWPMACCSPGSATATPPTRPAPASARGSTGYLITLATPPPDTRCSSQ